MAKKISTGLLFGSFNPVHCGHIAIAGYMAEFEGMAEIWFILSPRSPFKAGEILLDGSQRLMMLNLALQDFPKFSACDVEFRLPAPNYSFVTLDLLAEQYPERNFFLIMGSDNLAAFHKWKNYEHILLNHKILVYPRPDAPGGKLSGHKNVIMTEAPLLDVSSSFIRKAIAEGRDMRFLMPGAAFDYLNKMRFYR